MSNNSLLTSKKFSVPMAVMSSIMVVLGFTLVANWFGGTLMTLFLGHIPTVSDFSAADPIKIKKSLLIGQIGGTVLGLVLLPLVYAFIAKKEVILNVFTPNFKHFFSFALIGAMLTIVVLPLIGLIGDWNKNISLPESLSLLEESMRALEDKAAQMTKLIIFYSSTPELLMVLFTVALLPAIAEELVFRGILQNDLFRATGSSAIAILISSMVFSFIHFQFFGFFPRFLLGIILGYVYFSSGNILVSMLMHFLNNAMAIIVLNMHQKGTLSIDPESSKDLPIESIYLSIILSSALLYLCWKLNKERTE